jgi:ABC-type multidrug transport system fused ATPase/permease subunit
MCIAEYFVMQREQLLIDSISETATSSTVVPPAVQDNVASAEEEVAHVDTGEGDATATPTAMPAAVPDIVAEPALTPEAAAKKKKAEMQELEQFSLNNRFSTFDSLNSANLWVVLKPKHLTNPLSVHVDMHTEASLFTVVNARGRSDTTKQWIMKHLKRQATNPKIEEYVLPKKSPELIALFRATGQAATDKLHLAANLNRSKFERLKELARFLFSVIGTNEQRILFVASTGLNFASTIASSFYDHYANSVLITTIMAMASKAANAATGGKFGGSNSTVGLGRIIYICVMLRIANTVLDDLGAKLQRAGNDKTRRKLSEQITRHMLSQDLEDVDAASKVGKDDPFSGGSTTTPAAMLRTLTDSYGFEQEGLGQIIKIPQSIMQQVATIISSATILLGKSPYMVIVLYLIMIFKNYASHGINFVITYFSEVTGLSKPIRKRTDDGMGSWDVEQVLKNFEDMRVNAKENELLKGLQEKDSMAELETARYGFVGNLFSPIRTVIGMLPRLVSSYLGGYLVTGGSLDAVDIVGFQSALISLIANSTDFYSEILLIMNLEDSRFEYCFNLIDMLQKRPKIGLEGGYQAPPKPKPAVGSAASEAGDQLKRELDPPEYRIGGEIEFKNVCDWFMCRALV